MTRSIARPDSVPRWAGTLTFLFTDAEGSTELFEREPDVARRSLDSAHEVVRDVVTRFGGWFAVEQGGGDSTVAVFRRAADAATAAVRLQEDLERRRRATPTLRLRVAVLTGDVDQRPDGTYVGATLNRCGRLLATAHGDQVLTTAASWGLMVDDVDATVATIDLGEHHLRGIERPVRIMQLSGVGAPTHFPALRGVSESTTPLPRPPTSLLGRAESIQRIAALLERHRLTTIVGAGGVGKTRLAIEVGWMTTARYDRVCWVDLSAARSAEDALATLAAAVGLHGAAAASVADVGAAMSERADLIVLDNCEQVLDAVVTLATGLIADTPATLMATSREPLGIYGEAVFRVESLDVPSVDIVDPTAAVEQSSSCQLFLERAALVRPSLVIDEASAASIILICRRLDGLPLAIELAAARLGSATVDEVAEGLGDRMQLLTGAASGHLSRQRTLEASVAWSHGLLRDDERVLLRRLAVFAGSFSQGAAAAVGSLGDGATIGHRHAVDVLTRLVERSMLVAQSTPDGATRYRFLETIRAYALERLIESGETTAARRAHLDWFVEFSRSAAIELEGPDALRAAERCRECLPDIRSAIVHGEDVGDHSSAIAIVGGLAWLWVWQGHTAEIRTTVARLVGWLDDSVPSDRLQLQFCDTWTAVHSTALHPDIEAAYEKWMNDADRLGDLRHSAMARVIRGSHTAFIDPSAARVLIQEGLDACDAIGERFWSIYAEGAMALSWIMVERMDEADGLLDRMERRARSLGHPQLIADAVSRRAFVDHALGRYGALESGCREVESDFGRISTGNLTAVPRSLLISVEVSRGRASVHEAAALAMLTAYLRSGERQHVPLIIGALADVALGLGRAGEVPGLLDLLSGPGDAVDDYPFFRVRVRHRRALAAVASDDRQGARALLDDALTDCSAIGNLLSAARTNVLLAVLDRRDGEHRRAFDRALAAIELAEAMGAVQIGASAVEVIAALNADAGRPELAARLLGVGSRIRATGGVTLRLAWQADHDRVVETVRAQLTDGYDAALATGGALSLGEAATLANRLRGPRSRPKLGWDSLTDTEALVVDLAAVGRTNPEIAAELLVSRETVKTHLRSIFRKLQLTNRVELAKAVAKRA